MSSAFWAASASAGSRGFCTASTSRLKFARSTTFPSASSVALRVAASPLDTSGAIWGTAAIRRAPTTLSSTGRTAGGAPDSRPITTR
ncbi:hypothetical protein EBR56_02920, partial [bacterium]|nr:hypothetical protein [bacterium]